MSERNYIEESIQALENASQIYVRLNCSMQWAESQNNLGIAYSNRKQHSLEDNLQKAIIAFSGASQVYHLLRHKYKYLEAKFNLGIAYEKSNQLLAAYQSFQETIETANLNKDILFYSFDRGQVLTEIYGLNIPSKTKQYSNSKDPNITDNFILSVSNDLAGFVQGEILSEREYEQKFNEINNQLHRSMVRLCIKIEKYAQAVEYVERSKVRILLEMQAIKELNNRGQNLRTLSEDLQEIQKKIEEESKVLAESTDPNYDKIKQLRQEFIYKYPYKFIEFKNIQELTNEKTAIVEWYILGSNFCVFIITKDNTQPQILSFPDSDLERLIDWVNEYLGDYYSNRQQWQNSLETKLANLAEILHIDEILKSIPKTCNKLILIPHRYLHLFPIHALPVSKETWQRFHSDNETYPLNPYLIDCFDDGVRYTPSCQLLHKVQQQPERQFDSLLAIQTPTEDLYDKDYGVVDAIKQQFNAPVVIKKNQAKKSALLKLNQSGKTDANPQLQTANSLFFYCHGFFNSNSPLDSGLQLADDNLTLADIIAHFDLKNCRLVTMSACETGFTDFKSNSDEYIGLPSGFMLAGSHNIIGSLWTVSALATSLLMTKFHEELQQSNNIALALNQSQKWLRDVTIKELQDWLPKSQLEDVWQEELAATLKEWENNPIGVNYQPLNSPFYWSAFCAIGKGF